MSAHDHVPPAADPAQGSESGHSAEPGPGTETATTPDPAPASPATAPDAAGRKLPRAVGVALATAGLLAVTATSAAVTVAVGKPESRPAVAATAGRAVAPASASPTASPSASATATATTPPPAPVPAPTPTSTLQGSVSGARHDGDLRYFLLPIPAGGESYGPADGMPLTDEEMIEQFDDGADIMRVLRTLGYKDAATRTYRTADGKAEVTVTLLRFTSATQAEFFAKNDTRDLPAIEITGDPAAHGYIDKPKHQAYTGSMTGISSQGDVQYTVDVEVKGAPDKALLSELMKRQRDWLTSGR
ncbi:hypothetical protein ABTX81_01135 [Kitasatospora sp. NPDC097605]|uniref:hypothetical protein n=1 Tax=Kitasatospora sp. NPDC097605 TaxID=3157226 RepID=UPI00331880DF